MGKKKGGRGGGRRHYVTSEEDLDNRTKQQEAFAAQRAVRRADADGEEGEEGEKDEEGEEGEEGEKEAGFAFEKMRAAVEVVQEEEEEEDESPKTRKPKGVQGLIDIANPNAAKPQQKSMKAKDMKDDVKVELTRREREEIDKQKSADDYQRRHAAGQTDEFKADMERLALAKKRREEAPPVQQAEVAEETEQRRRVQERDVDDDTKKLEPREVKSMKPNQLKEHLKARGLSTQGQKKELTTRLLEALTAIDDDDL